jgi:geranylgeranylglycerol-phosphate geranylgeranyltransferase
MCAIVGLMVSNPEKFLLISDFAERWPILIMIFIGGWALSASAMVLNDYFDIEVDKINDPTRPIPSGEIKPKQALVFGLILILLGILMAIGIDLFVWFKLPSDESQIGVSIVTAVVCAIMASSYTRFMKRFSIIGNLAVSIGVWMGFLYGDLVFDFALDPLTESMAAAAFFLNFGREVAKGIIDVEGDRENNVTTIATKLGPKWTAIIGSAIIFLAIPTSILPIFFAGASWIYLGTIAVSQILGIVIIVLLLSNYSVESVKKIKKLVLYMMLISLISFTLEAFLGAKVGIIPSVIS